MKSTIITLCLLSFALLGFSQDTNIGFAVRGNYKYPIQKEVLDKAKTMTDINPGYPYSWVTGYISAEILATCNGIIQKAVSANDTLNHEQMALLKMADLFTDIEIEVRYNPKQSGKEEDMKKVKFSYTLIPEIEAQYSGGQELLQQYLQENVMNEISDSYKKNLEQATVSFVINEEGKVTNARISDTSEDEKIDQLLLDVINKMPKWNPARNWNGEKVTQEFRFDVGFMIGC